MSDPVRFLTAFGQALAAASLYSPGHPARERSLDNAFEQLSLLIDEDPQPTFSFLEGEVIYRQQRVRELKEWDWGVRLAKVDVQRIEFIAPVTHEDFGRFISDIYGRLSQISDDSAEARQLGRASIRFGPINVKGVDQEATAEATITATIAYSLSDEVETIKWMHDQVAHTDGLPLAEAEAVVRSLSLAMHGESRIFLPLLQLKEYDQYTTTHSSNVSVLAMALAESLGLDDTEVRAFGTAGLLHDLGKIRIPREILVKPGQFTDTEREVMRRHPADGARIILEREKGLDLAAVVAYEHHIMLNGGGYPKFKFDRECHRASKLVHVCDVYDALCTNRPYRDAWNSEVALDYLEQKAGTEFDPQIVLAFTGMLRGASQQRVAYPEPAGTETIDLSSEL
jgi:putative nucleotidyltransferase with HDIG domain